ncbi:hypothetical protein EON65_43045 [archaeon]|nr:MAG: hypothetical protein EON65_43045 [archaeon]
MHKTSPPHGAHCASCWDALLADNYAEYMPFPNVGSDGLPEPAQWIPSRYCESCIRYLLRTQWQSYLDHLDKPSCRAELRRLVKEGPPINIRDNEGLPCPDHGEVMMLWFMSTGHEESAMLKGAIVGEVSAVKVEVEVVNSCDAEQHI